MSDIFGRIGGPRDADSKESESAAPGLDAGGGRWLRRHLGGGVVALTTVDQDRYRAATLSACIVASIQPLQILISLEDESQMLDWVRASGVFAISLLSWHQQLLADRFAGLAPLAPATFHGINHQRVVTGSPVLTDAIGWADCRVVQEVKTGDHVCFIGDVLALGRGSGQREDPLVYYQSRYRRLH